jgi:pimeloyl-ACP methyl ester carboxylesterase
VVARTYDGTRLCVEAIGDPADPAILLIAGAAATMDLWDDELCERLADGGRLVIRYDHRDTGASTTHPPGTPPYSGSDLAEDAIAVLDALEIARAHLVGMSMGGGLAQELAFTHRDRIATLTLISTTAIDFEREDLPGMTDALRATFAAPQPDPDWSDRDAVIAYLVENERPFASPQDFDEARARARAERVYERSTDPAAAANHWAIGGDGPEPGDVSTLRDLPTLVFHGTADPFFPIEHGRSLAARIPGARLIELDGVGHQVPPPRTWDVVVAALLEHTA